MKKLLDKKIIQCKIIMRSLSAMLKIIGNKIGTLIRKKALSLMDATPPEKCSFFCIGPAGN